MKQRIISSLVGIVLLLIVIFFYNTIFFNITMVIISLVAVCELLNATKLIQYKEFVFVGVGFSVILPFAEIPVISPFIPFAVLCLALVFFASVLKYHSALSFEKMAMSLMFSVFVPLFFSSNIYLRDQFGKIIGIYYLMLALGSAWLSDTGAYFSGLFFGKHKLAPLISPKKTIEGAVGGVVSATVFNVLLAMGMTWLFAQRGMSLTVNYLLVGLISPFIAIMGVIGDLVASVIKRQNSVKDYGHIMPGHGGVMDRFDSVILTMPTVYVIVRLIAIAV